MNTNEAYTIDTLRTLSINRIASIVLEDWENIYFGARPYVLAMMTMRSIDDNFGLDSGRDVVIYFLANAKTWRGNMARLVKAELNKRLKE